VLSADRLSFGPVTSTKMACAEAGELEQTFLAALSTVTMYRVTRGALGLGTSEGPLMWFRVPDPAPQSRP
jgi:heat shock protein HslJ